MIMNYRYNRPPMNTSAPQKLAEITEIPRNWSSCVVTFPDDADRDIMHAALCGIGHVVMRNATRPNSCIITRDPRVQSHSFFQEAMMAAQQNHGATVQVLLRETAARSQPTTPNKPLVLVTMARNFADRVGRALNGRN